MFHRETMIGSVVLKVFFLLSLISLKPLLKEIMRWLVKLFFLIFGAKMLHLTNFIDDENQEKNINSLNTADIKSPEELTFDKVWKAYNGLRHGPNSVLARGHYTS